MIRFRDSTRLPHPPEFLRGAVGLQQRHAQGGTLWGCGDVFALDDGGEWSSLSSTLEVAGPNDGADAYLRRQSWARTADAADMHGTIWQAPRIIDRSGDRVFSVSYGPDFLPRLTPEQYRATDVAKAARDALIAAVDGAQDIDMALAARWAAELLAVSYHLSVDAIASRGILDDVLIPSVLGVGIDMRLESFR